MHNQLRNTQTDVTPAPGLLLIDAPAQSTLRSALERAGFRVTAARGGADAIASRSAGRHLDDQRGPSK